MTLPNDKSESTSECVEVIVQILQSEFKVNPIVHRSSSGPNVTFTVAGKQYRVYVDNNFEEHYNAIPQTEPLILSTLPQKVRASSTGAILISRSGITEHRGAGL